MDESTVTNGAQVGESSQNEGSLLGAAEGAALPEGAAAQKVIPETYSFNLPEGLEGVELDEATTTEFGALARKMQLSQDEAQELYEYGAKKMGDGMEAVRLQIQAKKQEWRKQSEATPEIMAGLDNAKRVVNRFGTPELDNFFEESGAGCNPEFLKFLCAVGDALKQDTLVTSKASGGEQSLSLLDKARLLYPNMDKGGNS